MKVPENPGFGPLRHFDLRLTGPDFERFSKLVYEQCGIKLPAHKQSMLEARLRNYMIVDSRAYDALQMARLAGHESGDRTTQRGNHA